MLSLSWSFTNLVSHFTGCFKFNIHKSMKKQEEKARRQQKSGTCTTRRWASPVGFLTRPSLQKVKSIFARALQLIFEQKVKSIFTIDLGSLSSLKRIVAEIPWHWSKVTDTKCWREFDDATFAQKWNYVNIFCTTCSQRGSSSVSTSCRWSSWSPTQLSRSCTCLFAQRFNQQTLIKS